MDVDDFLAHHGVKGMKWGKRKPTVEIQTARKKARLKERQKVESQYRTEYWAKKKESQTKADILYGLAPYNQTKLAQAAGFSKGKAVTIGILGGPAGGLIASELKIRKHVNATIR